MAYFGPLKCCSLRIFVFCIGILFLLVQTAFLILTFILMRDIENHVENFIEWLSEWGVFLPPPTLIDGRLTEDGSLRTHLIKKSGDYMAIPITCNVVLIISDTLLIWASSAKTRRERLLTWPWLLLHCTEWLFFLAIMIFAMYIVPEPWFRVVIFLVGCPLIVLLAFFWTVVKTFLNYWRDLRVKSAVAAVYQNGYKQRHPGVHGPHGGGGPATMYTPEPGHWDHPVPVWAMRPPPSVWDPDYLQQLDPRYALEAQLGPSRPSSRPLRTSSSLKSKPTQVLPDGTIVVPIGSEDDEDGIELGSDENESKYGSVRTLSDKYQKPIDAIDDGLISHVSSLPTASGSKGAFSEDRSSIGASIVSLSDKYRQQEEVEIFHEHYQKPPPEPVRPKKASISSQSTQSSKT